MSRLVRLSAELLQTLNTLSAAQAHQTASADEQQFVQTVRNASATIVLIFSPMAPSIWLRLKPSRTCWSPHLTTQTVKELPGGLFCPSAKGTRTSPRSMPNFKTTCHTHAWMMEPCSQP